MKPFLTVLLLTALSGVGCFSLPKAFQARGTMNQKDAEAAPSPPPPRVKPDGINAENASTVLDQLEAEVDYDEKKP